MSRRYQLLFALLAISGITGALVCRRLAQPKSSVNYGSPLGAALSVRNAVQSFISTTGENPFARGALTNLEPYGLDPAVIPMLTLLTTSNANIDPKTITAVSRSLSPKSTDHSAVYGVLRSGEIVQLPEARGVLGTQCPDNAKLIFNASSP
jgi:hypothetical protein